MCAAHPPDTRGRGANIRRHHPRHTGTIFRYHENVQQLRGKRRHDDVRPQKTAQPARQNRAIMREQCEKSGLEELAGLQSIPGSAASIEPLLAHGRMLHDLLPTVDAVVKTLLAVPFGREQESIRSDVVAHQLASRAIEKQFRALLYAISLLLLGSLIYLGLRLRRRTVALQRRAAFEHEIAGISTRFINCQRHEIATLVELALGYWLSSLVRVGLILSRPTNLFASIVGPAQTWNFRQAGPNGQWLSPCLLRLKRRAS